MMKTVIMLPLQKELDGFVQGCHALGLQSQEISIGRLSTVYFPQLEMTLAVGGLGKSQFALQTQHLLDQAEGCSVVLCVGAAGGVRDEIIVGDIVVGTTTIEHDFKNGFKIRPRPCFEAHTPTVDALRETAHLGHPFNIHFGTIASGDEDIVSEERRQAIQMLTDAMAVAWEGAGGARACQFSQVPFVEVRGITDVANEEAAASFDMNLEEVMGHVAQFIVAWIGQQADK